MDAAMPYTCFANISIHYTKSPTASIQTDIFIYNPVQVSLSNLAPS